MKARRLTSLLAGVLLLISNGVQAENSGQSSKYGNDKNVSVNLKIDNNRIKKENNNLTTEDLIIYLFGTLVLGGGLYYGFPYCHELYKKYVPVKPLNLDVNKGIQSSKENIEFNLEEKNKDPKKNIKSSFKNGNNEYEKCKEKYLGAGGQGSAWLFKDKKHQNLVVVKKIVNKKAQECEKLAYENREMLSACEYFCKPLDYFEEDGVAYAVYEYIENVGYDKFDNIVQNSEKGVKLLYCKILIQVVEACKYLNKKGFCHRDTGVRNILLTKDKYGNPKVKFVDYGCLKREKRCAVYCVYCVAYELNEPEDKYSLAKLYKIADYEPIKLFDEFVEDENGDKTLDNPISYDEVIEFFKNEMKKVDK